MSKTYECSECGQQVGAPLDGVIEAYCVGSGNPTSGKRHKKRRMREIRARGVAS